MQTSSNLTHVFKAGWEGVRRSWPAWFPVPKTRNLIGNICQQSQLASAQSCRESDSNKSMVHLYSWLTDARSICIARIIVGISRNLARNSTYRMISWYLKVNPTQCSSDILFRMHTHFPSSEWNHWGCAPAAKLPARWADASVHPAPAGATVCKFPFCCLWLILPSISRISFFSPLWS